MKKIEVSVVICTYNSEYKKLLLTLNSVLKQKDIKIEVFITDDGSHPAYKDRLQQYCKDCDIDICFIYHEKNLGTIRNGLSALKQCRGKYCYMTSPGDVIYDDATMRDFYNYCEENNLEIVFGNSIPYSFNDGTLNTYESVVRPLRPQFFDKEVSNYTETVAFNFDNRNHIIGVSYFRRTSKAVEIYKELAEFNKYVEDTPGTMLELSKGNCIRYFDRNITWYEYGTGISTSGSRRWNKIIHQETLNAYKHILSYNSDDIWKIAYRHCKLPFRINEIYLRLCHSEIAEIIRKNNKSWTKMLSFSENKKNRFKLACEEILSKGK